MNLFSNAYFGKRVLLTGHTGFKGSWLALWLNSLGANVTGVSLDPVTILNHWDLLELDFSDNRLDIRDSESLKELVRQVAPDIIFHLAAQPLVRRSYHDPLETWSTNVLGTANLMDACRDIDSLKAVVVVTTDKCYENQEWLWGYRENDRLGGRDPYSASKATTELVVSSFRDSFFSGLGSPLIATARAGNVIGGGDWSEDRLIPDLVRSVVLNKPLEIRSPDATRPWQHVLESLSGYLLLGQKLMDGDVLSASAWNFGPETEGNRAVAEILDKLSLNWPDMRWHVTEELQPYESKFLYLDSAKARGHLKWQPIWKIDTALAKTAEWYSSWLEKDTVVTRQQLAEYIEAARSANATWVGQ